MNKKDYILIVIVFIISIILFLYFVGSKGSEAIVYYENKAILKIDLNINNNYTVDGYNGHVNIEVKDKKIRVVNENSENNVCSKQGFIANTNESIICLPNKIIIEINGESNIDTQVK